VAQVSAFYVSANPPRSLVRFCFCKTDDKLQRACDALEEFFGKKRHLENGA
jgi:aspartate/methionine/tyrosine aminotransferase